MTKIGNKNDIPRKLRGASSGKKSGSGAATLTFSGKDGVKKNIPLAYFPKSVAYFATSKKAG